MKIAFITDAHGNNTAFQTVLEEVKKQNPTRIILGGDMIGPYLGTKRILESIKQSEYPCVMGNVENWVLQYYSEKPNKLIKESVQFRPTQNIAGQLNKDDIEYLKTLPFTLSENSFKKTIMFCHALPYDLWKSYGYGITDEMERELSMIDASIIISGHLHRTLELGWKGKLLVISGSCGIPLKNKHDAEYLIIEYRNNDWHIFHKSIKYDYKQEIKNNLENGFLKDGGPIAWLMIDELIIERDHLIPFFQEIKKDHIEDTVQFWETRVKKFLENIGRWGNVRKLLVKYG